MGNLKDRHKRTICSVLMIIAMNLQWCAMYFGRGIASFAESDAASFLFICFVFFIMMQSIAGCNSMSNRHLRFLFLVQEVAAVIWKVVLFEQAATTIGGMFLTYQQLLFSSVFDSLGVYAVSYIMQYNRRLHFAELRQTKQQTLRITGEKERLLFELHMAKRSDEAAKSLSETSFGTCSELVAPYSYKLI